MQQPTSHPTFCVPEATMPAGSGRGVDAGAAERYERVLRAIAAAAAPGPGSAAFFEELVRQVGSGVGVRWAWIGDIATDAPARVTTLAMWGDGALRPPMTYPLDGSACEHAMTTREGHHVARGVQRAFPRSAALAAMGAESYYGVALRDEQGVPRGMLTVVGIPARIGLADVKNHLATERLLQMMGTDIFYYHGYAELYLSGKWVKATPAFNLALCEKFRVLPLEFDGETDSIFHPYDADDRRHMEYVADRGAFADMPFAEWRAAMLKYYPNLMREGPVAKGDFAAEAEASHNKN